MHFLIAPNAFKNSLSAADAAAAIHQGLMDSQLVCTAEQFPVGDGGDGTASLILAKKPHTLFPVTAKDPSGREINSHFGITDVDSIAVLDMSDISGLKRVPSQERNPVRASSYGTGQMIKAALDQGVRNIILCIGGSATVDGGCGILQALGVLFLDEQGQVLDKLPSDLARLNSIDLSKLDSRIRHTRIDILCDVNNSLLGEEGAAMIFGPQKGATTQDIWLLEKGLAKLCAVGIKQTGVDMSTLRHGGAAGGTAAGLHVFLNAGLWSGTDYFLDTTSFDESLAKADMLITGEGCIDRQTLDGKAPFGVAKRAKTKNVPVIGMAGQIPEPNDKRLNEYFSALIPISDSAEQLEIALQQTSANLRRCAAAFADQIFTGYISPSRRS